MEMVLSNGFSEMTEMEAHNVDGGAGLLVGVLVGAVVTWVVDGAVEATTGKDVGGWIATGIKKVKAQF